MANLGMTLDFTAIEPSAPTGVIPVGEYNLQMASSQIKPTQAGDGHFVEATLEVLDGQYKGRKFWMTYNVWNKNETTVRIAQQELSAIGHAVGVYALSDTEQLHGKPFTAEVVVKAGTERYPDPKNAMKNVVPYKGVAGLTPAPVTPRVTPAANPFAAPVAQAPAPIVPAPVAPQAPAFAAPAPVAAPSFAPQAQAAPVANPFAAPAAGAPQPWAVKS